MRIDHDIDYVPWCKTSGSNHGGDATEGNTVPMDLDGRDGIVVVSVHQYNPPDPSVPPLRAATEPAGFQLNGFRGNCDLNGLPDLDCVGHRRGSLPTHAQNYSFTEANPQSCTIESFSPRDHDPR